LISKKNSHKFIHHGHFSALPFLSRCPNHHEPSLSAHIFSLSIWQALWNLSSSYQVGGFTSCGARVVVVLAVANLFFKQNPARGQGDQSA
jgi:hypothetical protein